MATKSASSARLKEQQSRRVLDSAARQRRARKALESLEKALNPFAPINKMYIVHLYALDTAFFILHNKSSKQIVSF